MKVTTQDLLEAIREYGKKPPNHPSGKGWYTIAEMAKREGVGIPNMRYRLKQAMARGVPVERYVGSGFDTTGELVKQTWFRVKLK